MIREKNGYFLLSTASTTLLLFVNESGRIEQVHYGNPVRMEDGPALRFHPLLTYGTEIQDARGAFPDHEALAWSGWGRGDLRESPLLFTQEDGSSCSDFVYRGYRILQDTCPMESLPTAGGKGESLLLTLRTADSKLEIQLIFTVFAEENVICRRTSFRNLSSEPVQVTKLMSFMMDLPGRDWGILQLTGAWNREAFPSFSPLPPGRTVHGSQAGTSSNRSNPAFALYEPGTDEDHGRVYGFNLIYSGNHYASVEESPYGFYRIQSGIHPEGFSWTLSPGESLETPQMVMTFSDLGFNGMSQNFHRFLRRHLTPAYWQDRDRPIALNSWEAFGSELNEHKLMRLAKRGKELGMELFVVDDGWFQGRNGDRAGLGDYAVDRKKLPGGLARLAKKVEKEGLAFGLWVEPEGVNPDSDLYRAHPDYVVNGPQQSPLLGRNELLLDLTRKDVADYIVENMNRLLDELPIRYIKWDMNRPMADFYGSTAPSGEFSHRYICSLYSILHRIFDSRPEVLLEMCASGGNRFDLGMLAFAPQIWASDNTDPIDRLQIQKGLSYFYPPSCLSCHVSAAPHSQTLRSTPLSTRFNVAAFGVLGYELDLRRLSPMERKSVKKQIAYYKKHRSLFQRGAFYRRGDLAAHQEGFALLRADGKKGVLLLAQRALPGRGVTYDLLRMAQAQASWTYTIQSRPQDLNIARFGHLLNYVLPKPLKEDSRPVAWAARHFALEDGSFSATVSGTALKEGIFLPDQFRGTGYRKELRIWGDWGSQIYLIEGGPGTMGSGKENFHETKSRGGEE